MAIALFRPLYCKIFGLDKVVLIKGLLHFVHKSVFFYRCTLMVSAVELVRPKGVLIHQ